MNSKLITINGYDTYFTECKDDAGNYLLIAIPPFADKDISNIVGSFVDDHLIRMIDYVTVDGSRFIKAYYEA